MKLIMEPIQVTVQDGRPALLCWRGRRYAVSQVAEQWAWRGRWWLDAALQGEARTYYRVFCQQGHFEVYQQQAGQWMLSRVLD